MLVVDAAGDAAWSGEPFTSSDPIGGSPHPVRFVDELGATVGEVTAHGYAFDHVDGGHFVVPVDAVPRHSRARLDLRGRSSSPIRALQRHFGRELDVLR
jgi:hypothetical protein